MTICKHGNDEACHECDLEIPCPVCRVEASVECSPFQNKQVHFGRRLKRLVIERRPDLAEDPS